MPSAVTDLVRRWGSFDQRGGGDECQEGVDEVPDELVARKEEEDRQEDKNEREDDEGDHRVHSLCAPFYENCGVVDVYVVKLAHM